MAQSTNDLGRLVSIFGIHPSYLQRAVFVAVLSFLFFIAMMFAFYMRQQFGYFLLATAFLFVYIVTMLSWVVQRKMSFLILSIGTELRDPARLPSGPNSILRCRILSDRIFLVF